jgi:hypothetical protein
VQTRYFHGSALSAAVKKAKIHPKHILSCFRRVPLEPRRTLDKGRKEYSLIGISAGKTASVLNLRTPKETTLAVSYASCSLASNVQAEAAAPRDASSLNLRSVSQSMQGVHRVIQNLSLVDVIPALWNKSRVLSTSAFSQQGLQVSEE